MKTHQGTRGQNFSPTICQRARRTHRYRIEITDFGTISDGFYKPVSQLLHPKNNDKLNGFRNKSMAKAHFQATRRGSGRERPEGGAARTPSFTEISRWVSRHDRWILGWHVARLDSLGLFDFREHPAIEVAGHRAIRGARRILCLRKVLLPGNNSNIHHESGLASGRGCTFREKLSHRHRLGTGHGSEASDRKSGGFSHPERLDPARAVGPCGAPDTP